MHSNKNSAVSFCIFLDWIDLASRRAARGPAAPKVHQFAPPPVCSNKDIERWEGIRRASQQNLQEKETRLDLCYACLSFPLTRG